MINFCPGCGKPFTPTEGSTGARCDSCNDERNEEMAKGFKNVQKQISQKEGIPMKNAGAILASSSRNASPAAKKANPNLKKVNGK